MWINADQNTRKELAKILQKIWNGEKLPERWKTGIISTIFKKENKNDPANRGVTLLDTAYKIWPIF